MILANSVNTKCRPFQVKINCSKLIIDSLQQWRHVTFLIYLFVTSRNLFFWCISATENCYNLTNWNVYFLSVGKIFLKKYLWKTWIFKNPLLHMIFKSFLRFLVGFFCTYLLMYSYLLFVSYSTQIVYSIHIHICK